MGRLRFARADSVRACYFTAPKRLSNEFDDTIGAEPVTWAAAGAGDAAAVAEASVAEGFSAGLTAACLVSTGLASGFGATRTTDGCGLASATFGLGGGGALAGVASAVPPMPTLRARLEKKPSDFSAGAAEATRVAGGADDVVATAAAGSSGCARFRFRRVDGRRNGAGRPG